MTTPNDTQALAAIAEHVALRRQDGSLSDARVSVADIDTLIKAVADRDATIAKGTAELRRYVEGNGFKWCEDESTVFNVTTAIGLMGGTIEALRERVARLTAERDALVSFAKDVRDGYDHEPEAHRYDNGACRKCNAEIALDAIAAGEGGDGE